MYFIGFFCVLFVFVGNEVFISDGLCVDKVFFEVGVDFIGCLWCGCFDWDGLCVNFFYVCGEVGLQVQQSVIGVDYVVQVWFFEVQFSYEFVMFFIVQFGDVCFNGGVYWYYYRFFLFGDGVNLIEVWVVFEIVFIDVCDVYGWFQGQEVQIVDGFFFFFGQIQCVQYIGVFQLWQVFFQCGQFNFCVFIVVFGFFGDVVNCVFVGIKVRQCQFGVDNVNIFCWVYFFCDVNNIIVFKVVNYMVDGFGFMDVGQKLVVKIFIFGCVFYQVCDIYEFYGGWQDVLWFDDFSQFVQMWIGYWYDIGVWFNGIEGEVGCFNICFGECIEQGGFVDVG